VSLAKKLTIKPGQDVLVLRAPQAAVDALALPSGVRLATTPPRAGATFDVVLVFVSSAKGLADHAPKAIDAVREGGALWFAYPKRTSGVVSDLSRDEGWSALYARGWGPVSQVAVDATWSAVRMKPESAIERKTPGQRPTPMRSASKSPSSAGTTKRPAADLVVPDDLVDALKKDKAAHATWKGLAPSQKREYVGWITEAKRAETRARRIAQAVALLAEGVRDRNAKYRG
jgi:hypothetical protein